MNDPKFWRGRRVFLTGHTGFKGCWLSLWLQKLGAEVCGFALPPQTDPSLFELAQVARGMESITANVKDLAALRESMQRFRPEIVFHLAAQSLVRPSYEDPVETFATNIMGTVNLLETARGVSSVRAIVVVTSDKCYENREWVWGYRENEPMGGHDPYSSSKGCAELVTAAYRSSFFAPPGADAGVVAVATARAGNVIGGGDWARDRLVPDLMRALAAGQGVLIRNPSAVRPWQFVLEPLSGYLLLAQRLLEEGARFAEAWNFGPRDEDCRPVSWLVARLAEAWGEGVQVTLDERARPHEATHLKLDISKAVGRLRWAPRWSLVETVRAVADWHKAHLSGADMRSVVLRQIDEFTGYQEEAAIQ